MNWFLNFFSSTIGRKLLMALTGLFLILFLVVHLAGNLQLLHADQGKAFNVYARFMTSNPLVVTISIVNFALITLHIVVAILLSRRNRIARGPEGYAVVKNSSTLTSRNMGILGTLVLVFLVVHLKNFWYETHFGNIEPADYDGDKVKNLFLVVDIAYQQGWYVILYVVSMVVVGFHLYHGFGSAFQTLGLNHVKYNGLIRVVGIAFSIIVPALFALIPILMYFDITLG
jgi:succinate dehydrogenase / fumarate reductase, cytochrome b subunit